MKDLWIIEDLGGTGFGANEYRELAEAVKEAGSEAFLIDIKSYPVLDERLKELNLDSRNVFFQGSIQLYRKLRAETPARPLGWMTDNSYKCSVYYPYFQNFLFNNQHCFVGLGTLKKEKWFFYSVFGKDALIYVRPDAGDKLFTGRLLDLVDFDKFFETDSTQSSAKNTDLIVVSSPKNIRAEYRFIVKAANIIAHSTYLYMGQRTCIPSVNPKATELCKKNHRCRLQSRSCIYH